LFEISQIRSIAFVAIAAAAVLIPPSLLAQDRASPDAERAAPVTHDLSTGMLKAELVGSAQAGPNAAGSPAFASISITANNASLGKRGMTAAELVLEAVNGTIKAITGPGVKADIAGDRARASITGLRHASPAKILVEMTLNDSGADNSLKLVLRDSAGQASRPVTLTWTVRDCAGNYYTALQEISKAGGSDLANLIRTMAKRDPAIPTTPLFRVPLGGDISGSASRCVRYEVQWDVIGYRWRRICVRHAREPVNTRAIATPGISQEERRILLNAASILRSGGADPKLTPDGSFGWVSGKVAQDLRLYLVQDKHPALCTGAIQFTEYYSKRLSGLKKHISSVLEAGASARSVAKRRVDAVKREAASFTGGHPGIGFLPLRAIGYPVSSTDDSIRGLILTLAPYAGLAKDDLDRIASAANEFEMLKAVREAMDGRALPDALAKTLTPSFALIEAAYYLKLVERRYQQLKTGYIGSLEGIRAAHDAHCVCKS
jgi:hypothetical protein